MRRRRACFACLLVLALAGRAAIAEDLAPAQTAAPAGAPAATPQAPASASSAPASSAPASPQAPAAPLAPSTSDTLTAAGQALTELQRDSMQIEVSTAGFYELAEMARELGLQDSGTADELRSRIYKYYGIQSPTSPQKKGRTVTIERAAKATYAKVEEEEGGIIRASGGVILTLVEENGDTHRIEADSIAYDRARSTLTARGSVRYERKSGSTVESFSGETVSANLDDWSGIFLDGTFRRSGSATASTPGAAGSAAAPTAAGTSSSQRGLVITADTILKRSSDVMVLKNGVISACDADDPHYAIRAGRVWILGNKEWAMTDAVFSLGNVPILWLPFFYYPGDELVFNPVIGYRSREGRFVQTTTYLIGTKPQQTGTSSILSFQDNGPAQPTELKGLYLRTVSGPAPKDNSTLKVLADGYSGLGYMAGLQGDFPKLGFLGKTSFFAAAARSRTLFSSTTGDSSISGYSPYSSVIRLSKPVERFGLSRPQPALPLRPGPLHGLPGGALERDPRPADLFGYPIQHRLPQSIRGHGLVPAPEPDHRHEHAARADHPAPAQARPLAQPGS